jgi:1-phosphofructokinase
VSDPDVFAPLDPSAGRVAVFGPAPRLMVTIERWENGPSELHVHPGGQGVWVARMVRRLGAQPLLCATLGGETGTVIRHLLRDEGIQIDAVPARADSGAAIHDGREGDRDRCVYTAPDGSLDRHELDRLYNVVLAAGLDAGVCALAGTEHVATLPSDTFRRLARDLPANGARVVADLSGDQLRAAVRGGVEMLKVSDEDLVRDGMAESRDLGKLRAVVEDFHERGAGDIVITRGDQGAIALIGGEWFMARPPRLEPVNTRGAGDSATGALATALARGLGPLDALRLATAAAAISVTRHGLATGERRSIEQMSERIEVEPVGQSAWRRAS